MHVHVCMCMCMCMCVCACVCMCVYEHVCGIGASSCDGVVHACISVNIPHDGNHNYIHQLIMCHVHMHNTHHIHQTCTHTPHMNAHVQMCTNIYTCVHKSHTCTHTTHTLSPEDVHCTCLSTHIGACQHKCAHVNI